MVVHGELSEAREGRRESDLLGSGVVVAEHGIRELQRIKHGETSQ